MELTDFLLNLSSSVNLTVLNFTVKLTESPLTESIFILFSIDYLMISVK